MSQESTGTIELWTANKRAALVMKTFKSDTSVVEAIRRHGLTVVAIEDWQERFPLGAENALRGQPKDDEAFKDE